jgi:hypothetical protein
VAEQFASVPRGCAPLDDSPGFNGAELKFQNYRVRIKMFWRGASAYRWEELNRPWDPESSTEKVPDSPAKSISFIDFPEDDGGPKTTGKGP